MRLTIVILSALLCLSARAEKTAPERDSDDAIVAAAEKLVGDNKPAEVTIPKVTTTAATVNAGTTEMAPSEGLEQISQDIKKESEIPVFAKSDKVVKSEGTLIWRLVGSLAFIAVVGGVLLYAGRRWSRQKNKGGEKARIEILHQYHMGPKKSLALIRVAGEAILIGCTDQSINMLKTVTLLDDELEGVLNKDFNGFLDDEFSVQDMRTALSSRA